MKILEMGYEINSDISERSMASTICLFFKYGYCKFGETCRLQHVNDLCSNSSCETSRCLKRHPKNCKFFKEFNRCKFGTYCAYLHTSTDDQDDELNCLKVTVKEQEDELKSLHSEVASLKEKLAISEKEMEDMKIKLSNILESFKNVTEQTVERTTNVIIQTLNNQHAAKEKKTEDQFNLLNNEILALTNLIKRTTSPSPLNLSTAETSLESLPNKCIVCHQSFLSDRALKKHIKTDHKPI